MSELQQLLGRQVTKPAAVSAGGDRGGCGVALLMPWAGDSRDALRVLSWDLWDTCAHPELQQERG